MGQKYCKRINLEISHELYNEIKQQSKELNISMRMFILRLIMKPILIRKRLK